VPDKKLTLRCQRDLAAHALGSPAAPGGPAKPVLTLPIMVRRDLAAIVVYDSTRMEKRSTPTRLQLAKARTMPA
jgi:hypothetical protein